MNAPAVLGSFAMALVLCAIARGCMLSYGLAPRTGSTLALSLGTCGIAWAASARFGAPISLPGVAMLACAGVCAATDAQSGYIFDRVLLAAVAWIVPVELRSGALVDGLAGAAAAGAALTIPYALSRGRAIGFGDVKFAGTLGLALGLSASLAALWVACVCGGGVAAIALATGRARRGAEMRFGPFLALGACVALTAGW